MKKNYLLILTFFTLSLFSQKDYSRYYNSWRLGINGGVAWQTSDIRSCYGGAGGFTLEKGLGENATNFLSFAIRGRYLGANTYGMSPYRNYNIATNSAYNGSYNASVNYYDSLPISRRYIYENYKTKITEGSLELQVTFNRLREQKHVLLNLWGGVGITSYRSYTNMLDENGKKYNFTKIDSTDNISSTISSYNSLIDKSYESNNLGSKSGNVITFSPSGGIGLGYQFSPGFSMLWEYKVTLPQGINADLMDGKYSNNNDNLGGNKDYYHYTGLNLLFTLRGKNKTKEPIKNNDNINNYTTTTPINTVVPTNSITATPSVVTIQNQTLPKPVITYITPSVNGQITNNAQYKISAQILNIDYASQIKMYVNSFEITNFAYNKSTHILEYNSNLNLGSNPIQIIATNAVGNDNESTSVVYQKPEVQQQAIPPTVEIVNPRNCPFTSNSQQFNLLANTGYITNKNQITVKINNITTANFSFNSTNGQISLPMSLVNGNNNVFISVTNAYGNDVASCNIVYNKPQEQLPLPIITITNPTQSGYVSSAQNYSVKATILNVTKASNISLYYNGMSTPFSYDINTKQFSFTANLLEGSNSVAINAVNSAGEDNKSTTIIYKAPVQQGNSPVITLISPNVISSTNATPLYHFKFGVLNVISKNDLNLIYNGAYQSNFTYNSITKEILFDGYLNSGSNSLIVNAANNFGVDSKTVTVKYAPRVIEVKNPPKITFVTPLTSPAIGVYPTYEYKATITNVPNNSGLVVKYNGITVSNYTYNGSTLTYSANLISGNNILEITATNNDGSDMATGIVNRKTKVISNPPVVTPVKPLQASSTTTNAIYNFNMHVINVSSQNNIEVTFNGVPQTNFTYNTTTNMVDFTSGLLVGNNSLTVKGTNNDGSDNKTVNIIYEPYIKRPPVVTITSPAAITPTITYSNYSFNFNATNVNQTQVSVKLNGNSITNFNFIGSNGSFSQNLKNGLNTLDVEATNNDGTSSASAQVFFKSGRVINTPTVITENTSEISNSEVTICFKQSSRQYVTMTIPSNQLEAYLRLGATVGPCAANTTIATTHTVSVNTNTTAVNTNTVSNNNNNGGNNNNNGGSSNNNDTTNQKITICHKPPGNKPNYQTISVSINALAAHLAHGDSIGACGGINPIDTAGKKITICHFPPGNTSNPQTITIPISALPAHLAHGDAIGGCSNGQKKSNINNTGGGKVNIGNIKNQTNVIKTNTETKIDTINRNIVQPIKTMGGRPR